MEHLRFDGLLPIGNQSPDRNIRQKVYPLDVKMTFDDNALPRHPELEELHDPEQEDPTELRAHKAGLQYIQLNGNIACLVNGAGLAMATMDTIKLFGGEPDNFLDIGGGASPEKLRRLLKSCWLSRKSKLSWSISSAAL